MPSRCRIGTCATLLTFIWTCQVAPPAGNTASAETGERCIERILAADDSLARIRNHACEIVSLSEAIQQYQEGIDRMAFEGCPEAFHTAFQKHGQAWLDMTDVTDRHPDSRGELHVLFDQIAAGEDSAAFRTRLDAILTTWREVERAMDKPKHN